MSAVVDLAPYEEIGRLKERLRQAEAKVALLTKAAEEVIEDVAGSVDCGDCADGCACIPNAAMRTTTALRLAVWRSKQLQLVVPL